MIGRAIAAGGTTYREPEEHGFMYGHGFQDLDGHIWESVFIEPNATKPARGPMAMRADGCSTHTWISFPARTEILSWWRWIHGTTTVRPSRGRSARGRRVHGQEPVTFSCSITFPATRPKQLTAFTRR
jgi:hypothetical protein